MKDVLLELVKKGEVSGDYERDESNKQIERMRKDLLIDRRFIREKPISVGAKVAIFQQYTVLDIYEDTALCIPVGGGGLVEIPLSMLVCV